MAEDAEEDEVVVRFIMRKRQKYQRPAVFATGVREKLWKLEYREYFLDSAGKEQSRHKSATWSQANFTKAQAQVAADKLLLELQRGPLKADGTMTLDTFWRTIYLPIRRRKWTGSTEPDVLNKYKNHILPTFGSVALQDITKAMVQIHLGRMVDAGLGEATVGAVKIRLHSILEEALDNDIVPKNVCRKVETPTCKEKSEARSLTEAEVQQLWDETEGRDYLFWRILILTGARIGEVLVLERADIRPDGLMIDEAVVCGKVKLPKRNKKRLAALPESLRAELEEWLTGHDNRLLFPSPRGLVYPRNRKEIQEIPKRGRKIIPGLTFRQCRTTFASLFQGDEADRTSIMGHTDTKFTLERYRKPIMERRQRSVEELDRRLKVVPIKKRQA
jgi:integrase